MNNHILKIVMLLLMTISLVGCQKSVSKDSSATDIQSSTVVTMVNAVKVFTLRLCISAYYIHFKRVKVKIFTAFTILHQQQKQKIPLSSLQQRNRLQRNQLRNSPNYQQNLRKKNCSMGIISESPTSVLIQLHG